MRSDRRPSIEDDVAELAAIVSRLSHLSLADVDGNTRAIFFAAARDINRLSSALNSELEFRESVGLPPTLVEMPARSHVYKVTNPRLQRSASSYPSKD